MGIGLGDVGGRVQGPAGDLGVEFEPHKVLASGQGAAESLKVELLVTLVTDAILMAKLKGHKVIKAWGRSRTRRPSCGGR